MAEQQVKISERVSLGENVTAHCQGNKLVLVVDLAKKGTLSKKGAAVIKAATPYNFKIDESHAKRLDCEAWFPAGSFINVSVGTPKRLLKDESGDDSEQVNSLKEQLENQQKLFEIMQRQMQEKMQEQIAAMVAQMTGKKSKEDQDQERYEAMEDAERKSLQPRVVKGKRVGN